MQAARGSSTRLQSFAKGEAEPGRTGGEEYVNPGTNHSSFVAQTVNFQFQAWNVTSITTSLLAEQSERAAESCMQIRACPERLFPDNQFTLAQLTIAVVHTSCGTCLDKFARSSEKL